MEKIFLRPSFHPARSRSCLPLLGILIFWGIAATSYRGTHITVDLVWANSGRMGQRIIDVVATLVLLFVVTVQKIGRAHV